MNHPLPSLPRTLAGLLVLLVCAIGPSYSFGQDPPERPPNELTLIDDTHRGEQMRSASISTSTTTVDGVRTTQVNHNGRQFKFIEDPASGITCYITERYGAEEVERLKEEQPELHMYLSSIPDKLGNSTIRVTVDVETKYHAATEEELKEQHPKAFEYFQKYVKQMADNGAELHLFLENGARPLRFRVDRNENRVQEIEPLDDDDQEDDESKEDGGDMGPG